MDLIYHDEFDTTYQPAMSTLNAVVQRNDSPASVSIEIKLIVDTGADATMIPINILRRINAKKGSERSLIGVTGVRIPIDMYTVVLQFGRSRPMFLEVIGSPANSEPIIGRDIINQFAVLLDGPASTIQIS